MPRRWFWILFSTIVFLAGLTRLWKLGEVPVSVYWDEAAMLVDIKSVLATGQDMHGRPWYQLIYPSYGDYKLPAYIWAATAASKVVGFGEFGLRLPSALAGIATVVIAGYLIRLLLQISTKTIYSQKFLQITQLLTMFVVAITPWSIMFSRTGFEGHLGQMLLALSLLLTALAIKKKKFLFFLTAATVGGLATYSYFSVRFVWVAVYLGCCITALMATTGKTFLAKIRTSQSLILQFLAGLFLFVLLLIPLLQSPLARDADKFRLGTQSVLNNGDYAIQSNLYRELAGNTLVDRLLYHRHFLLLRELAKNYSDHLSTSFLFLTGDPNLRHGTTQFGLFLIVFAPALVTGILVLLKRHTVLALFLLGWWMVALLPASVPENTPHALRSLNALVPLSMMIGFGLSWWWMKLAELKLKNIPASRLLLPWSMVVICLLSFAQFWWFYQSVYPKLSAHDWQAGYKLLAYKITELTVQGNTVVVQPFDDRFYLWLMAYGPYTAKDFQSWPTQNYKFQTDSISQNFRGIEFQGYGEDELKKRLQDGKSFILVGQTDSITERCKVLSAYSCQIESISDEVGNAVFSLAKISP